MFISVEGTNAMGKSTIINTVCDMLIERGYKIFKVQTPSQLPVGQFMRKILNDVDGYTACLINAADRNEIAKKVIIPKLEEGYIVISDRFSLSPYLYNNLDGIPYDCTAQIYSQILKPDFTFILDLKDHKTIIDRIEQRKESTQSTSPNEIVDKYEFNIKQELDNFHNCIDYFKTTTDKCKVVEIDQNLQSNATILIDCILELFSKYNITPDRVN